MKQWMRTLLAGTMAVFFAAAMPVTAAAEELRFPEPAESNVFTAPALITVVDTQAELDALSVTLPDTAVFRINDAGEAVLADGSVIGTAAEAAAKPRLTLWDNRDIISISWADVPEWA